MRIRYWLMTAATILVLAVMIGFSMAGERDTTVARGWERGNQNRMDLPGDDEGDDFPTSAETLTGKFDCGEQYSEAYLKVNPHGLIPALVHHTEAGDITLSNSLAIIEYLDEVFAEPPLLPADAAGRARVRQICQAIAADIHPVQNLRILQIAAKSGGEDAPISVSWAKHWI